LAPVTGLQNAASGAQLRKAESKRALSSVSATWVLNPPPSPLSSISSAPRREESPAFWNDERPPVFRAMTISPEVRMSNTATLSRVDGPSRSLAPSSIWSLVDGCSAKFTPLPPSGRYASSTVVGVSKERP